MFVNKKIMSMINVNGEMNAAVLIVPYSWGIELLDPSSLIGQFVYQFGILNNGLDLLYEKYILTNTKIVMKFLIRETKKITFHTIKSNQPNKSDFRETKLARVWAKFLFREKEIEKLDRKRCYFRAYTLAHYREMKGKVSPLGPLLNDNTYQSLNRIEFDKRWEIIDKRLQHYIECISFGLPYDWSFDGICTDDTLSKEIVVKKKRDVYLCNDCKKKRKYADTDMSKSEKCVDTFIKRQCENISDNFLYVNYQPSEIVHVNNGFDPNITYPSENISFASKENNLFQNPYLYSEYKPKALCYSTTENVTNEITNKDVESVANTSMDVENSESRNEDSETVQIIKNETFAEKSEFDNKENLNEDDIFPKEMNNRERCNFNKYEIKSFTFGDELTESDMFHKKCEDFENSKNCAHKENLEVSYDIIDNILEYQEDKSIMGLSELNELIRVDDNIKNIYQNVFD